MQAKSVQAARPQSLNTEPATASLSQLAQLSAINEADLRALVDYGVLTPVPPGIEPWSFSADGVEILLRADRLRKDLVLDIHAFALAVMLLGQITGLEAELGKLQSELLRHSAARKAQ